MVKKRNLKRLLAVVLSFAMAIQPASLMFAEETGSAEPGTQQKSDVIIAIAPDEGDDKITTSLNGDMLEAGLRERVKVTSELNGEQVPVSDAQQAAEAVTFAWHSSPVSPLDGAPMTAGTYQVKALLKDYAPYNDAQSEFMTVMIKDAEPVPGEAIPVTISGQNIEKEYDGRPVSGEDAKAVTDPEKVELSYTWKDKDGKEEIEAPVNAGQYQLEITPADTEKYAGSEIVDVTIKKREITVSAKDVTVSQNAPLPKEWEVDVTGEIVTEDDWAVKPSADCGVKDTSAAGVYPITAAASVKDDVKDNYDIILKDGSFTVTKKPVVDEDGRIIVEFRMRENDLTTEYNGKPFEITKDKISNLESFNNDKAVFSWFRDGQPVTASEVEDAGKYGLTVSVPEEDKEFKGSTDFEVTILPREITVNVIPDAYEINAGEMVSCKFDPVNAVKDKFKWVQEPSVRVKSGDVNKAGEEIILVAFGGDAGGNYTLTYGESEPVKVKEEVKPVINSVLFPKKSKTYSAKYTGEPIQPAMTVGYSYQTGSKTKTEKLKLNVDYTVTYRDNVNVGNETVKPTVIIEGIGGYAGYLTAEFTIEPKDIKKAVISPVGDILSGDEPEIVVNDGIYELEQGVDFTPKYDPAYDPAKGVSADTPVKVTIEGIGNYTGTVKKTGEFTVLASAEGKTHIRDAKITVNEKNKKFTYNGKAQKAAVKVMGTDGKKLKSAAYKVVYTDNVNAGTATVWVVGKNKGGYYGRVKAGTFEIGKKDFKKVKASNITIPKVSALDGLTLSVKDGKRVLVEGKDFYVEGGKEDVIKEAIKDRAKNCSLTLKPVESGNYVPGSSRVIKVKFTTLNMASKTAKVTISPLNGEKVTDEKSFEVVYNGRVLERAESKSADKGDYYVAKFDSNKKMIKITALKNSIFKGSRTFKGTDAKFD